MTPVSLADRYSLALRRGWYWCVALAAVGAVSFPLITQRGLGASSSAQVAIVYDAPSVQLVEFKSDLFSKLASFRADLATLKGESVMAGAERAAGAKLEVAIVPDEPALRVSVLVRGRSLTATDLGLDFLIATLRTHRREVVAAAIAEFDRSIAQLKPVAEQRVKQLDAQLAALNPADGVLAQALRAERTERADDLLKLDAQRGSLEGFAAEPNANVTVGERDHPSTRTKLKTAPILSGAILGLLAAAAGIVLLTWFARRVRTRSDVQRLLGDVPVLGLPAAAESRLTRFARHVAPDAVAVSVLTDPRLRNADHWRSMAGTASGDQPLVIARWDDGAATTDDIGAPTDVVLLVDWGRTRDDSVVAIASTIQALGGTVRGVAIANVPSRYAEQTGL